MSYIKMAEDVRHDQHDNKPIRVTLRALLIGLGIGALIGLVWAYMHPDSYQQTFTGESTSMVQ